tara:strand:+ start:583 stop:1050 length:468 start_codon:yes stop_codon:yes gene_type:complete
VKQLQIKYNYDLLDKKVYAETVVLAGEKVSAYYSVIGLPDPFNSGLADSRSNIFGSKEVSVITLALFLRNLPRPNIGLEIEGSYLDAGKKLCSLSPIYIDDVVDIFVCLRNVFPKTGRSGFMIFIDWEILFCRDEQQVAIISEKYVLRPYDTHKN